MFAAIAGNIQQIGTLWLIEYIFLLTSLHEEFLDKNGERDLFRSRTFFYSPIPRGIDFIFLDLQGMLNCPFLIPRGVKFSEELPFYHFVIMEAG